MERKNILNYSLTGVLAFFLIVGVFMYTQNNELFVAATPFMILAFALIAINYAPRVEYLAIAIVTFFVEVLGVLTGFPFGNYYYTDALGTMLFGVPILIGINWVWICIGAKQFMYLTKIENKWLQATGVGLLVLIFDILLEPIAIALRWWVWPDGVGLANYASWFVIGFIASFWIKKEDTYMFPAMFIIQVLFFIGLYLVI